MGHAALASPAYLCHWGRTPAPQLHPGVPHGWSGQKAGGMPGAWRESWQGFQAPGGGGGDHSCRSGGELGRGAHQGFQGSAEEEWGWGLSGLSRQAIRTVGTLRILPSPLSWSSIHNMVTPFLHLPDFPNHLHQGALFFSLMDSTL